MRQRVRRPQLRQWVDSLYGRERGIQSGIDPLVSDRQLASFLVAKVGDRARGVVTLMPHVYRGRRVRIRGRDSLALGKSVAIAADVLLDAVSKRGIQVGDKSTIDIGAVLRASGAIRNVGEGIVIGKRTAVGAYNVILGQGGVYIGDDCLLGPGVQMHSENHIFKDREIPIREQGEQRNAIRVGNDVWIGANSVVLAGSVIHDGAVVAANSVVRGEIAAYSVVAGAPASQKGTRGEGR
ncbi:acyltransferase [Nocardioides zeae]|uniref:acyltransferase n=1 Tax=Nocardioides zeae TaxID=1457234 RepID=UPI0027D8F0F3|nr:acyltransferase [Nocardioides zeae]